MMQRIVALVAYLIAVVLAPTVFAESRPTVIKGYMTCNVSEQKVLAVDDGRASVYSSFQEKFDVGDSLTFEYEYQSYKSGGFYAELKDIARSDTVMVQFLGGENVDVNPKRLIAEDSSQGRILLGQDYIMIRDSIARQITLQRYYKSDWAGLYVSAPNALSMTAQVVALDCRTGTDAIEKIIEAVIKE